MEVRQMDYRFRSLITLLYLSANFEAVFSAQRTAMPSWNLTILQNYSKNECQVLSLRVHGSVRADGVSAPHMEYEYDLTEYLHCQMALYLTASTFYAFFSVERWLLWRYVGGEKNSYRAVTVESRSQSRKDCEIHNIFPKHLYQMMLVSLM